MFLLQMGTSAHSVDRNVNRNIITAAFKRHRHSRCRCGVFQVGIEYAVGEAGNVNAGVKINCMGTKKKMSHWQVETCCVWLKMSLLQEKKKQKKNIPTVGWIFSSRRHVIATGEKPPRGKNRRMNGFTTVAFTLIITGRNYYKVPNRPCTEILLRSISAVMQSLCLEGNCQNEGS